jgi:hypothetical protein
MCLIFTLRGRNYNTLHSSKRMIKRRKGKMNKMMKRRERGIYVNVSGKHFVQYGRCGLEDGKLENRLLWIKERLNAYVEIM